MRIKIGIITAIMALWLNCNATSVTTVAGGLSDAIGDNTSATTLVVTGEINADDLAFISEKMPLLTSLDLSDATIVGNELPAYSLMGTKISTISLPVNLAKIGEASLSSTAITSITIPASVTTIADAAFSNCDNLIEITIPSTVTNLGTHTFLDCNNLTTVALNANITEIGEATFARCNSLSSITLPEETSIIGNDAFLGCTTLTDIKIPVQIEEIGNRAFQQSGLTKIDLSTCENLKTIGDWAFAQCASLTTIALNDNVSTMGEGVFFDDKQLVIFKTPASCENISDFMLKGTSNIVAEGILHDNVTEIGDFSLMGMKKVAEFTIPASVVSIGNNAFEDWTDLKVLNVDKHNEIPTLGENIWQDVDQSSAILYVSENMFDAFSSAAQWQDFDIKIAIPTGNIETELSNEYINTHFEGYNLNIKATSEIANVCVYDSSGRQFINLNPQNNELTIDTSSWDCHIYIINVVLYSGETATVKLARR